MNVLFPFLNWGHPITTVQPSVIIPISVSCQRMFSVIKTIKFKAFNDLPLNDAVKSFNVTVFFGCGQVGEFLIGFCYAPVLLDFSTGLTRV
jgi:hypothetical protein